MNTLPAFIDNSKLLTLKTITSITLKGVISKTYPVDHGNCFSVIASDDNEYRILNFNYENFRHLIDVLKIDIQTVKILPITKRYAVIHEESFPHEYYQKEFCEVCCPAGFLPFNQKLRRARKIASGELKLIDCGDFTIEEIHYEKRVSL